MGPPLLRRMAPPLRRLRPAAAPPETWPRASTSQQVLLTQTLSTSDGVPAPLTRPRLPLRSCARRPARPATFPVMATVALPAATAAPQYQGIVAVPTACSLLADRLLQHHRPQQPHDGPRSGGPLFKTSAGGSQSTSITACIIAFRVASTITDNLAASSVKSAFLGAFAGPATCIVHLAFVFPGASSLVRANVCKRASHSIRSVANIDLAIRHAGDLPRTRKVHFD